MEVNALLAAQALTGALLLEPRTMDGCGNGSSLQARRLF